MSGPSKIKVRQIEESDTNAVVALLLRGFSERTADYWYQAMERLRKRHLPGEFPRFGFGITDDGVLKGVLLIIFSKTDTGDIRANASSWYVEPNYRLFANMLLAQALRIPNVTFVNVSPNPSTLKTIGMQGFGPYVGGTYVALGRWPRFDAARRFRALPRPMMTTRALCNITRASAVSPMKCATKARLFPSSSCRGSRIEAALNSPSSSIAAIPTISAALQVRSGGSF